MAQVAVVGGGLVGSLITCILAKRGFNVELYESRPDPRTQEHVQGKSINLALSERGRSALRILDMEDDLLKEYAIPMRSRLIHDKNGNRRAIPYGEKHQYINSVGRRHLNEILLTKAETFSNVKIFFEHKLTSIQFESEQQTLKFLDNTNKSVTRTVNFVFGADGAFSATRRELMKKVRMNFSQTYIEHGYMELCIPATAENEFAMEINHLHIWPRGSFMMIALPNLDKSYTVTLFMPFEKFEAIKTPEDLIAFFEMNFHDAIPLIGREKLISDFFNSKPSPLISIKCEPYNFEDKALIIGDAAHAMVPFYGQGMNCGFEDCSIIDEMLTESNNDLCHVIKKFGNERFKNCWSICDLAMYNYIEMRDLVNSPAFLFRKKFDNLMNKIFRNNWIPLYTMVTFSRIPYQKCVEYREKQNKVLAIGFKSIKFSLMALILIYGFKKHSTIRSTISSFLDNHRFL